MQVHRQHHSFLVTSRFRQPGFPSRLFVLTWHQTTCCEVSFCDPAILPRTATKRSCLHRRQRLCLSFQIHLHRPATLQGRDHYPVARKGPCDGPQALSPVCRQRNDPNERAVCARERRSVQCHDEERQPLLPLRPLWRLLRAAWRVKMRSRSFCLYLLLAR
jgi:hypothetical protein